MVELQDEIEIMSDVAIEEEGTTSDASPPAIGAFAAIDDMTRPKVCNYQTTIPGYEFPNGILYNG